MRVFWKRSIGLLLAAIMLISLVPAMPVAKAAENDASSMTEDEQWAHIKSLIAEFADQNTWKTSAYSGAIRQQIPLTALLGNGNVGVTSNGSKNRKSYHLSSTDFWSDNSQEFGYRGRSPQIITGGGITVSAYDRTSGEVVDPQKSDFLEELDIARAEIRTSMYLGNAKAKLVDWLSAEKNIMVTEITSEATTDQTIRVLTWGSSLHEDQLPIHAGTGKLENGKDYVWATRTSNTSPHEGSDARWMSEFAIATTVFGGTGADYTAATDGSIILDLPAGETVYVVTAIKCDGNQSVDAKTGENGAALKKAAELLNTVESTQDIQTLHQAHLDWWRNYYLLSWADFGDKDLNRLYYGNQYIFACCTREGEQAPGLYGVWITRDDVGWQGDYHLNYNFQAPYYGSYSSNRLMEFSEPMFKTFLDYIDSGIARAADPEHLKQAAAKGTWYYTTRENDPSFKNGFEDAILLPVGLKPYIYSAEWTSYLNQTIDALFCAVQICTYYNYTLDYDWLMTKQMTQSGNSYSPYDFLAKTANFYVQWVEKRAARVDDVFVKDNPSTPTNQTLPTQYTANYAKYPEYDPAVHGDNYVYVLFDGAHENSYEFNPGVTVGNVQYLTDTLVSLGESAAASANYIARFPQWKDLAEHLVSPSVSAYTHSSGLTVFGLSEDRGIRDISATVEMEWIHPGYQLGFNSDPELVKIAQNTVNVMGNKVSPGWGMVNNTPKIFTHAARCGYNATELISKMKAYCVNKMAPNNYINDNTHGWEKAGILEALNTMMVMSDGGIIKTFPTWNDSDAQFHTIRMPGAFLVSSELSGGKVQYIDVTSEKGSELKLVIPWDTDRYEPTLVDTATGETVAYTTEITENSKDPYLTAATEAGKTYRLTKGAPVKGNPEVPENLTLENIISKTEILVSWDKNTKEGDDVSYVVTWTDGVASQSMTTEETSAVISGLTAGQSYTVTVQATYGGSRLSQPAELTVQMPWEDIDGAAIMAVIQPDTVRPKINTNLDDVKRMLPTTVTAMVYDVNSGYHSEQIPVSWNTDELNPADTQPQILIGAFDGGFANPLGFTISLEVRMQDNHVNVVSAVKENLNDELDLTALGTVDWIQIKSAGGGALGYERKNNGAERINEKELYFNDLTNGQFPAIAGASDFAIRTKWTDGTPTQSKTDPVATNKIGNGVAAGVRCQNSYVEYTVQAQPGEQTLVLSLGAWQSLSTLEAWISSTPEDKISVTVDSKTDKIGGGLATAHYNNKGAKLVTLTFSASDPDEQLILRYTVTKNYDSGKKGQAVLQAIAVSGPVLEIAPAEGGRLVTNPTVPAIGDKVTIEATADEGYLPETGAITITGVESTDNTFTMPNGLVRVQGGFVPVKTLLALVDETPAEQGEIEDAVWQTLTEAKTAAEKVLSQKTVTAEEVLTAETTLREALAQAKLYEVIVRAGDNGKVEASCTVAHAGTDVTVTVTPEPGYRLESLTAVDSAGGTVALSQNRDNTYSFQMPACNVTITADFRAYHNVTPTVPEKPAGNTEGNQRLPFRDVRESDWFYDSVCFVYENGMMNGTSADMFVPMANATRGMIVTILYRLENEPAVTANGSFGDVAGEAYYADAVAWAAGNKIVNGYGDGRFGPNDTITREQMAAILYRYAMYKNQDVSEEASLHGFADEASVGAYAYEAMQWAVATGLINGRTETTLVPGGTANRAEIAAMLQRFCQMNAA